MTALATQEQYSERADAYAKMGSLTWRLADMREACACACSLRLVIDPTPRPSDVSVCPKHGPAFNETKAKQLEQKARWIKAMNAIKKAEGE